MSLKTKQTLAKITMVLCALSWGVSFVVVKDTLLLIPTNWTLVIRYGIAGLIMALISGKNLFKLNKAEIIYGCLVGGTAYFGMYFQTAGLNYTTPGKSAFITAAYCVMVPFITWIWTKKRPSWQHFAAAFVCIIGIGLIALNKGFTVQIGDALTLGCTIVFAVNFVMIDQWFAKLDIFRVTMVQMFITAVLALIAAPLMGETAPVITKEAIGGLLYISLIATAAGMLGQNIAQRFVDPSTTALLCSLESVFAVLASVIMGTELLSARLVIGFILVFGAVVFAQIELKNLPFFKKKKEE